MKTKFDCGLDELYLAAILGWNSCLAEIIKFKAHKGFYLTTYIDDMLAKIQAADDMPDDQVRNAVYQLLGSQLKTQTELGLNKWQGLKSHILTAYPTDPDQQTMLDAAGAKIYSAAAKFNWEKVKKLMNNGSDFIVDHSVELLAGDNMPVGFEAEYNLLKDGIVAKIPVFLNARQNSKQGTQDKIIASNIVYDDLLKMFADGVYIFKADEAKHDLFVFEKVLAIVTPPGQSGTRLKFIKLGDNTPIEGVAIMMQKAGGIPVNIATDASGRVQQDLEPGTYKMVAKKTGFDDVNELVIVETGVLGNKVFVMQPV